MVLAGAAVDPLSTDCLAFQRKLAERLRQVAAVDDVFTLATAAEVLAEFRSDWPELTHQNTFIRNLLLGADDTVHFLAHYKEEKQAGLDTVPAVCSSLLKAGPAIAYTSIITAAGFAVLVLADFKPIRYFGVFTGVTMIIAWMGDVFILPACVAILRLWDQAPRDNTNSCYPSE